MTVNAVIAEFVYGKDRVQGEEVAAFLLVQVLDELGVERSTYDEAATAKVVVWRGAMACMRDVLKRPSVVEHLLNGDNAQHELMPADYSEFVRTPGGFVRRANLSQEEYRLALALLRERRDAVAAKVARYEADYERALPFWSAGLSFAAAMDLAGR